MNQDFVVKYPWKKKGAARLITGMAIIGVLVALVVKRDSLPPLTPHKAIRLVSGLPVPRSVQVLEFRNDWSRLGAEGITEIRVQLDAPTFERLTVLARAAGYQPLPVSANAGRWSALSLYAAPSAQGWYLLREVAEGRSVTIVVLDATTLTMLGYAASR